MGDMAIHLESEFIDDLHELLVEVRRTNPGFRVTVDYITGLRPDTVHIRLWKVHQRNAEGKPSAWMEIDQPMRFEWHRTVDTHRFIRLP